MAFFLCLILPLQVLSPAKSIDNVGDNTNIGKMSVITPTLAKVLSSAKSIDNVGDNTNIGKECFLL
ncbi:MAG: hypothetical protein JNL69_09195 [Bacteroidia bacterium]|nr:hypothetical protein [Bacteroidia bacterium]